MWEKSEWMKARWNEGSMVPFIRILLPLEEDASVPCSFLCLNTSTRLFASYPISSNCIKFKQPLPVFLALFYQSHSVRFFFKIQLQPASANKSSFQHSIPRILATRSAHRDPFHIKIQLPSLCSTLLLCRSPTARISNHVPCLTPPISTISL